MPSRMAGKIAFDKENLPGQAFMLPAFVEEVAPEFVPVHVK